MKHFRPISYLAGLTLLAGLYVCLACPHPAAAQSPPAVYTPSYVDAGGNVGTNAAYVIGKSPVFFIELQRFGADAIEAGIRKEDPGIIAQGIAELNAGVARESTDGSFPVSGNPVITGSNANAATGAVFHSTSLFFEGLGRACADLKAYSPSTYTLAPDTYSAQIAAWSPKLEATATWLTNQAWTPPGGTTPISVPALGYAYDANYTHRYALLSAGLQECENVTGDANLITETYGVNWWIDQYFTKQLGASWTAAIPESSLDGGNTPATLVAPGGTAPAGTGLSISAAGVLPEAFGYDVSYGMVDLLHFFRWWQASSDATRKAFAAAIVAGGCQFERSRQNGDGSINIVGSSRVGVETNQNGIGIKAPSTTEMIAAFINAYAVDNNAHDLLGGIRLRDATTLPNGDPIDAQGAIGGNSAYDAGAAATYDLTRQKDAAYWIAAGIEHENDAQIQQGLTILQWGFAQQGADGSFPGTGSKYSDAALFTEVASRCVLEEDAYAPISHPADPSLASQTAALVPLIDKAQAFLAGPTSSSGYVSTTSASKVFSYAGALIESSVVTQATDPTGSAAATTLGQSFLTSAEALMTTGGTCQEAGAFVPNSQAASIGEMEAMIAYGNLPTVAKVSLSARCANALVKEESAITPAGAFTFVNPATQAIETAFQVGGHLLNSPPLLVWYQRMAAGGVATSFDPHP